MTESHKDRQYNLIAFQWNWRVGRVGGESSFSLFNFLNQCFPPAHFKYPIKFFLIQFSLLTAIPFRHDFSAGQFLSVRSFLIAAADERHNILADFSCFPLSCVLHVT